MLASAQSLRPSFHETPVALSRSSSPKPMCSVARTLIPWELETDLFRLEDAWFHSRVLEKPQYEAFTRLLEVFARHLGLVAAQIPVAAVSAEAPAIQKARAYIESNQHEELRIQDVAKVVNMSVFYFCKVFKKATGKTFTEYLAAVRVAKAKNLLLNPHARVAEIAFQSGFQSITHFNRIFLKLVGQSPTAYRKVLFHSAP
ncbi:MAG: hypothetical protein RLZZ399_2123 [Verrucomicrobiota bacterium]|jgi:AraC-like DNA-binding protein